MFPFSKLLIWYRMSPKLDYQYLCFHFANLLSTTECDPQSEGTRQGLPVWDGRVTHLAAKAPSLSIDLHC